MREHSKHVRYQVEHEMRHSISQKQPLSILLILLTQKTLTDKKS